MLINQGDARFEARYLPTIAQVSPGFGATICDVDADGLADIYLVQNTYSPQPETGRMDGGLSVLLKNLGKGEFVPQESVMTGLLVPGDAKALALTDIDHNGQPDFAVTNNNSRPQLFQQRNPTHGAAFAVRLKGDKGNPSAIGAILRLRDGKKNSMQSVELYAGSGYLTQSAPIAFFARPAEGLATIEVQWPNGDVSKHDVSPGEQVVMLTKRQ